MIEADLEELANGEADMKWLVVQAEREEAFIKTCIERIQPLRKYGHLPDHEAFEAAQRDEWRLELIHRAENYITSQGFVPHDEIATMRSHPDWEAQIFPHINMILEAKDKDELGKLLVKRPEHAALIAAARAELAN